MRANSDAILSREARELDDETLERAEREALERPSNSVMWDDRLYVSHGPVISWAERGDDVLAESNYLMVLETLQGIAGASACDGDCCWVGERKIDDAHSDDVIDATINDWLVGSLRQVFVRVRDDEGDFTPAWREAVTIALALRDYPVFDESDYSEREWTEFERVLEVAIGDALRAIDDDRTVPEDIYGRVQRQVSDEGEWCRAEDVDWREVEAMVERAMATA